MNAQMVIDVLRQALMQTFWLALPLLAVGFVAGAAVSLIQILTSIQDSAFGAVPRLAAFLVATLLFLPWILNRLVDYTAGILGNLGRYAQ